MAESETNIKYIRNKHYREIEIIKEDENWHNGEHCISYTQATMTRL